MDFTLIADRLFEVIITGDRRTARLAVQRLTEEGVSAEEILEEICWPALDKLQNLYRADQLSNLAHHYASRLLRTLIDQLQPRLQTQPQNGRTVLVTCGPDEPEEIAGQMACDLLEAEGFDVYFCGGGVANDEILDQIGRIDADVILVFGAAASSIPATRTLIDEMHSKGICPRLQVGVGGGVFNRAEGLAEEIGADIWASSPLEMVRTLRVHGGRRMSADQRTVGRRRKGKAA